MARSTSAVLAALIAVAPLVAAHAQAPAEQTPPPVTTPSAPADAAAPATGGETAPTAPADTAAPTDAAAPAQGEASAPAEGQAEAPAAAAGDAQQQVGSYYTQSTHGDWQLRCLRTQDGKDPCELYQLLRDDQQTPVAEFSVIPYSGEAAAIINFVAPLETDLEAGMAMQIGSGETNRYPFMVCAPVGCVSRLGVTQAELDTMKRGSSGTVSLLPFGANPEEGRVRLNLSLSGFTAGFTELQNVLAANN